MTQSNSSNPPDGAEQADGGNAPYAPVPIITAAGRLSPADRRRQKRLSILASLLIIFLPTLISAVYFFGFATDKYEAAAVLSLRSANASGGGSSLLGFLPGAQNLGRAGDESFAMIAYIRSRDALVRLDEALNLRESFSDPRVDFWQRLSPDASFEGFYSYYQHMVTVYYDEASGQIHMDTRAFDAEMAQKIALTVKSISESLVNQFNARSERDVLEIARLEVAAAENRLKTADAAVTRFRIERNMVDPIASTSAIGGIIAHLGAQIAQAQAELRTEEQLSNGNPTTKIVALTNRIKALEAQMSAEQARLTGEKDALAPVIEEYQNLVMAQEIARQAHTAALTALQSALAETQRQKLYLIDIVSPSIPEQARLPNRPRAVLFTFLGSIMAWFFSRLLIGAIRDHIV